MIDQGLPPSSSADLDLIMKTGDAISISIIVAHFVGALPALATGFTALYMAIRVWETETVHGWRNTVRKLFRKGTDL